MTSLTIPASGRLIETRPSNAYGGREGVERLWSWVSANTAMLDRALSLNT